MKLIKFLAAGIVFGIVMAKSEALSWYRIQEMFRFQSFHMYGIIGTAVIMGAIGVALIKKLNLKDINGNPIVYQPKEKFKYRYIIGGTIFGLGWALTGACPGPIFVTLGYGYVSMLIVIVFALFGTYTYGLFQKKLPY
jgi:uncharacterized membrane protein YedE/YeeE